MRKIISIYFILSIITLIINTSQARSLFLSKKKHIFNNKKIQKNKEQPKKKDQYYIVFVENPYVEGTNVTSKNKRDLNDQFIDNLIGKINTLIVENKDTYESPEKLDEIDEKEAEIKKRNAEATYAVDYGDSNYVYKFSSTDTKTALYAYLSNDLAESVETMENVISCEPDEEIDIELTNYSSFQQEVRKETGWKNVIRRVNARLHLSLISQGKYDDSIINVYDDGYYYPQTAGAGIDIFALDVGFNFKSSELTKTNRDARCIFAIEDSKIYDLQSAETCFDKNAYSDHGSMVLGVAAGRTSGVAPMANVYGIIMTTNENKKVTASNLITAFESLKRIKNNSYKVIFNISFLFEYDNTGAKRERLSYLQDLINGFANKAIFVASAGNGGKNVINSSTTVKAYPCVFDNVICVGSIDNYIETMRTMLTKSYKRRTSSNYGSKVDIYAPDCAYIVYQNYQGANKADVYCGTSFSSALVSGVAATIIAEDQNTKYNSKTMLQKLVSLGIKNVITGLSSDSNNVLLNNGKHIVYSKDNVYKGSACGKSAGNSKCPSGSCCSKYGFCGTTSDHCSTGCQASFGTCK